MNKKILIIVILIIVAIIGVVGIIYFGNNKSNTEEKIIEIINNLNSGTGNIGDWKEGLKITKVNEIKEIDFDLMDEDTGGLNNKEDSAYMIDLQEKTYGKVQIIVINGEVTANSILGETYEDIWNGKYFKKEKIDINKINNAIK